MHRHRLLIAEADPYVRAAIGEIFSRMGWEVELAQAAGEAIAWLDAGNEPCCLLLDLELPDRPGESVLAKIRDRNLRTHVAVCTRAGEEERLVALAALKPDVVLTKPITVSHIWNDVCRVAEAH